MMSFSHFRPLDHHSVTDPQLLAQGLTHNKLASTISWINESKQKPEGRALGEHRHLKANKENWQKRGHSQRERRKRD